MTIEQNSPIRRRVIQAFVWWEHAHRVGITKYARKTAWALDYSPHILWRLEDWRGDGIICQLHPSSPQFLEAALRHRVPKVELGGYIPDIPVVLPDYYEVGRLAAEHFLERGFTQFTFIGAMHERKYRDRMQTAFTETVGAAGHKTQMLYWDDPDLERLGYGRFCVDRVISDEFSLDSRRWLGETMAGLPKPHAVFVRDHQYAIDLIDGCIERGVLIPEEISLVSVADEEMGCDFAPVPLSHIEHNFEEQGYRAAELLDRLMDGETPPAEPIFVPPKGLIVRHSSDVISVPNVEVAKALVFLKRNIHRKNLSVDDVVKSTDLSRAGLYRAMEQTIGHSIAIEISRQRCEAAAALLATTDRRIVEVAEACGFSNAKHLRQAFLRLMGSSPTEYRADYRSRTEQKPSLKRSS